MIEILGPSHSNFVRSVALICAQKSQAFQIGWSLKGEEITFGSDRHASLHPFSKVPVIYDGEVTLMETLAICRYLDHKFPENPLQPEDINAQAEHDAWCSMAITQIDQALIRHYMIEFVVPTGADGAVNIERMMQNKPMAEKAIATLEGQLKGKDYICGDCFTLADALIAPLANYACGLKGGLALVKDDSVLRRYVGRILQQPKAQEILA
ncbi:glutathione S-transferase family protein [Oceanospirillum maris]|uniref:glutathione S-transferase family protein n=1 Tax=Oceanospirillum maris TaxID=64977 RepID=UPI00040F7A77|nr:glutathione S-transferase family protein [Oceanospirillum maris]